MSCFNCRVWCNLDDPIVTGNCDCVCHSEGDRDNGKENCKIRDKEVV